MSSSKREAQLRMEGQEEEGQQCLGCCDRDAGVMAQQQAGTALRGRG